MLQGAQADKFRIIIPQLARQHLFIIYASFKMCLQWQIINTQSLIQGHMVESEMPLSLLATQVQLGF